MTAKAGERRCERHRGYLLASCPMCQQAQRAIVEKLVRPR